MVSIDTVQRLERGEPTISIGIFISALFVLGISNRFLDLTDPARDNVGLKEDINNLPKKIASIKSNVLDF